MILLFHYIIPIGIHVLFISTHDIKIKLYGKSIPYNIDDIVSNT